MAKVVSPPGYVAVFVTLLALTLLTYLAAFAPLGPFHTPVALGIAVVKASLVVLIFMHLIHSKSLTWLVVASALFMFGIMLSFTLSDYLTRPWMPRYTPPFLTESPPNLRPTENRQDRPGPSNPREGKEGRGSGH
jgi:cytochrome c oxidase subunit 4